MASTIGLTKGSASAGAGSPALPQVQVQVGSQEVFDQGETVSVEGTNVIRVPFGIRQARVQRPQRPERWATLVLPLQPIVDPTPPPQAA